MTNVRQKVLIALGLVAAVIGLWWTGKVLVETWFPAPPGGEVPWAARGQFGDMFGSVTSLMTAINLALLVYAILLQVNEASRQNEISKWLANYNYLLDAKKLITDHPEVLELHGLSAELAKELGVTSAQIAYVVIDLKAADLYYRIDGATSLTLTEYRKRLLESEKYRKIASKCVVDGTLLPASPFKRALCAELERMEKADAPSVGLKAQGMDSYIIRGATPADIDTLISFARQEAREAEGLELDEAAVRRGVEGGFGPSPFSTYWIAEADGTPVGNISVVREWSNFRGGHYWWIQSLFIAPEHRGTGLLRRLMDHASDAARASGALDLRLYAHQSNARALRVYEREGFATSPYVIMTRKV